MITRLKLVEPCNENRQVAEDQVIDARVMPIRQPMPICAAANI
jgi:hypothetical protein